MKTRILVIEDETMLCALLRSRLTKAGYDVSVAADGAQGLEKVKSEKPDLVILDLMLPNLTGEEVMRAIREDESEDIDGIPVIMLTAKAYDVDRIIGKMLGANAYLSKPFNPEKLLSEVERMTTDE